MVLPALLVGAVAIRSNALERRALTALGESMSRTRTYAELETAMFDQNELVWRSLSGLDETARKEFDLTGQVVNYWQDRWRAELKPNEMTLANGVAGIQRQIVAVSDSVFRLADAGRRVEAYRLAQRELKGRLQPALTAMTTTLAASQLATPPHPPIPALERPLGLGELEEALRSFHGSYYVQHPFHQLMNG